MDKILKIKVCGMRDPENIQGVVAIQPDYLGLIFYRQSKRFVGELPDPGILNAIPNFIVKTGVFVNEDFDTLKEISSGWKLDAIQLHGKESPELCRRIKDSGKIVLKAFSIHDEFSFQQLDDYSNNCDYFLFDTKGKLPGGTGQKFNWELLNQYKLNTPFFLSGGIFPDDVEHILEFNHPQLYGVDINSGFEISPALKDVTKLEKFIKEIRSTK